MLLREYIRKILQESLKVSDKDMKDAWEVFRGYIYNVGDKRFGYYSRIYKDQFFTFQDNIQKIPLSKVDIFEDWGRRIKGKRLQKPIVVLKMPRGRYQVLDGQHRVLSLREKGKNSVSAAVVDLKPIKKRAKRKKRF